MRQTPWLLLLLLPLTLAVAADAPRVGWMIYPYTLNLPEEQYQRLLNCAEAEYVGVQLRADPDYADEQARERAAELAAAGKRLIVQIWFGPSPPLSWERYNFPNIALDPEIREEFFARATDSMTDFLGPANLHALHLLEETGMQFAWDVDMPARPDRDDDGFDVGGPYNNPPNWIMSRCISGPNVLSIRKFNERFRADTGLDMRFHPIWSGAEMQRYRDWVQTTMEAGAHIRFAEHVHRKYPGLRVYAFNSGPALVPQRAVLDGHFLDPYTTTHGVYYRLRECRTLMRPDQELIGMTWGNRNQGRASAMTPEWRLAQQTAAWIAGCNVLSTFGDKECADEHWLNTVRDSVRPLLGLPVFRSRADVLVLGGWTFSASMLQVVHWITGFAHYDVCQRWAADVVALDDYDLVLSWGGNWISGLPEWVRGGGVLLAVWPVAEQNLLVRDALLGEPGAPERLTLDYRPDAWMREQLDLAESYTLDVRAQPHVVLDADRVHQDQFLHVARYGKGLVVLVSAVPYAAPPWSYQEWWEAYRQLLTDLGRGALRHVGKADAAARSFCDRAQGNDYLMATSADGRYTAYVLLTDVHGSARSATAFVVPGSDLISGRDDVRLDHDNPVVVVDNGKVQE